MNKPLLAAIAGIAVIGGAIGAYVVASPGGEAEVVQQLETATAIGTPTLVTTVVPSATPPPSRSPVAGGSCAHGTPVELEGETACSFTFNANDVPARLQASAVQVKPERMGLYGEILLHGTCAPERSCLNFATGAPVSEERTSQIDWRINAPATIVIVLREVVVTETAPAREFRLVDFNYNHPADNICTSDLLYCYDFMANYERVK